MVLFRVALTFRAPVRGRERESYVSCETLRKIFKGLVFVVMIFSRYILIGFYQDLGSGAVLRLRV